MQTATSETKSKSRDLSICVHHYTLRAPCPKGQGIEFCLVEGNGGHPDGTRVLKLFPLPKRLRADERKSPGHPSVAGATATVDGVALFCVWIAGHDRHGPQNALSNAFWMGLDGPWMGFWMEMDGRFRPIRLHPLLSAMGSGSSAGQEITSSLHLAAAAIETGIRWALLGPSESSSKCIDRWTHRR